MSEPARPPDDPVSPKPAQNTLFAFFAALFLAVLAALARDVIAPRVSGPRQLTALTGLPSLVVMPPARGRRRAAQAAEAYQALAASLKLQLSDSQRIVLVTSAHRGEERAAVAVGLGRALSASGVPALAARRTCGDRCSTSCSACRRRPRRGRGARRARAPARRTPPAR